MGNVILPHQSHLRKGRVSIPGLWYAITKCTHERTGHLVRDPVSPSESGEGARIFIGALKWMHQKERLGCAGLVVMPDHVHMIVSLGNGQSLQAAVRLLFGFSARRMVQALGVSPPVWQAGYYDRCIRTWEEVMGHWMYIRQNPVRRGYVRRAEDWPFLELNPDW